MQTIALREVQAPYLVTVDEQTLQSDVTVLKQNGQPLAVLLSIGEYEAYRAWQRHQRLRRQSPSAGFVFSTTEKLNLMLCGVQHDD